MAVVAGGRGKRGGGAVGGHDGGRSRSHLLPHLALQNDILVRQRDQRHEAGHELDQARQRQALEEGDALDELTLEGDVDLRKDGLAGCGTGCG